MVDYAALRASVLATFGEAVTVTVGAVQTALTAAFLSPNVPTDLGGVPGTRPNPQIVVDGAEWAATSARNGDTITRGVIVYTIVDAQPADDGMTTVILRRY